MRKVILKLMKWWLTPADSVDAGAAERKKAFTQGLKTYVILAAVILVLTWDALAVYCVWLLIAFIHGFYQYLYGFAGSRARPTFYEETAATLFLLDIFNHIAVGAFSRVGWWGLLPVAFAWFFFGRTVGTLAVAKELKNIFSLVRREYPSKTVELQAEMTRQHFQKRIEVFSRSL